MGRAVRADQEAKSMRCPASRRHHDPYELHIFRRIIAFVVHWRLGRCLGAPLSHIDCRSFARANDALSCIADTVTLTGAYPSAVPSRASAILLAPAPVSLHRY
jgi:hypothetical protein